MVVAMPIMAEFPQEIVVEIFSWLHAKSLCWFKCVSKPSRTLISDPHFAKTHLTRHKRNRFSNLCPGLPSPLTLMNQLTMKRAWTWIGKWGKLLGFCNGLILLLMNRSRLHYWTHQQGFIWNCYFLHLNINFKNVWRCTDWVMIHHSWLQDC